MNRKKLFGSLLEGQAKQWFTANFMFNAEIIPGDWDTFLGKARQHLGLLEPGKDAVVKLATLTQTGTVERYVWSSNPWYPSFLKGREKEHC